MSKKLTTFSLFNLKFLLEVVVVSVFVGLMAIAYRDLPTIEYFLRYDEAIYAMLSQRFLNGEFGSAFHPYWNSGFPLITIPFYLLVNTWESAQTLVSITSHLFLIIVLYLTVKKFSTSLAILASFFAAFSPSFIKLVAAGGITEPFYVLLFWLALYFGWLSVNTQKTRNYILAGVFFGLAFLTRTEAVYSFLTFLVFLSLSLFLSLKPFPSINKFSLPILIGGFLAYFAEPITRLSKFTTFGYAIFRSTKGILFASPFLVAVLLGIFFKRNYTDFFHAVRKAIIATLIIGLFFLVVNLPYILTISKNLGHFTLSGKYSVIGSGHQFTPEKDRMTTWAQDIWSIDYPNYQSPYYDSTRAFPTMWKYIEITLEATWKKIGTNMSYFAHGTLFTDFEAALILLGLLLAILHPKYRKFAFYLFILWAGSFILVSYSMDPSTRYVTFSFPIFYIAQSFAVFIVASLISQNLIFYKLRRPFFVIAVVAFAFFYFNKNYDARNFTSIKRSVGGSDQKIIADYLRSQNIDLIMARTEGISYYSNAKIVYMPAANPETIIKFAKGWGVEYLLARPQESSWDYMRSIANPKLNTPDLELKHKFPDGSIIWKVRLTENEKLYNFRTTQDVNKKTEDLNVNSQVKIKL